MRSATDSDDGGAAAGGRGLGRRPSLEARREGDDPAHLRCCGGSGGRKLLVDNVHGYVHVTGYSGSQVQVTIEKHIYADSSEAMAEAKRDVKMDMSQQGNFVRLYEDGPFRNGNGIELSRRQAITGIAWSSISTCRCRIDTELVLKTVNRGDIQVKKTTGDYEIHGLNGGIEMEEIAGSGW